jgi:hypothetical protein
MYMTNIQTFAFEAEKRIFIAWAKLKEYRCKVIATDSSPMGIYIDTRLCLILSRSQLALFKLFTRVFIVQPTYSIPEKIDILEEYEIDI